MADDVKEKEIVQLVGPNDIFSLLVLESIRRRWQQFGADRRGSNIVKQLS